jgi:hypothetical protein
LDALKTKLLDIHVFFVHFPTEIRAKKEYFQVCGRKVAKNPPFDPAFGWIQEKCPASRPNSPSYRSNKTGGEWTEGPFSENKSLWDLFRAHGRRGTFGAPLTLIKPSA